MGGFRVERTILELSASKPLPRTLMSTIRNSAKAIIIRDHHLLAIRLQDKNGYWYTLPGGGQERGENLHDALRRECREEINSEIVIGDLRFVRDYIGNNHEFALENPDEHSVEIMFICGLEEGAAVGAGDVPDKGQLGIDWLPLDKLDSYRLYPLGLRPLLTHHEDKDVPIYLGDIN